MVAMLNRPHLIVIIEDDDSMLNSVRRLLAARNFDVEDFPSAEEFLASSVSKAASCLVVDIGLRGMSGIELKRQMIRHGVRRRLYLSRHSTIRRPSPRRNRWVV